MNHDSQCSKNQSNPGFEYRPRRRSLTGDSYIRPSRSEGAVVGRRNPDCLRHELYTWPRNTLCANCPILPDLTSTPGGDLRCSVVIRGEYPFNSNSHMVMQRHHVLSQIRFRFLQKSFCLEHKSLEIRRATRTKYVAPRSHFFKQFAHPFIVVPTTYGNQVYINAF